MRMRYWSILMLATVAGGCCKFPQENIGYFGVTEPMSQVVQAINANNRQITTVWARHEFDAVFYDDKGSSHSLTGSGNLLLRKPEELYLKAAGVIDFFEVGANEDHYWFTVFPREISTQWWGLKKNFTAAGARQIPIRPDLMMEVLGVTEFDTNLMQPPAPVMRFNHDRKMYMFVWSAPVGDHWAPVKEIWYDFDAKNPTLVILYNRDGRVILRAYLSEHQQLDGKGPRMATRYELFFPENKSQLSFKITDLRKILVKNGLEFPNDGTFAFPEEPGVEKRIEIR